MAITWPESLPAPLRRGWKLVPGSNVLSRTPQVGRKDISRWGSGSADIMTCTLRLQLQHPDHGNQLEIFSAWYQAALNMGINWIAADWLETIGYTGHYLRIVGYCRRAGRSGMFVEYQLTMHIKKTANCWPDTTWPVWTA